jgi:hypothetical protein
MHKGSGCDDIGRYDIIAGCHAVGPISRCRVMLDKTKTRWFFIAAISACMVLVAAAQVIGQNEPVPAAGKEELSRQLKIYRDALFSGSTSQMRSDAATELLISGDETSRGIVLAALKQDDPAARMAVCKVLVDSRRWPVPLKGTEAFIEPLMAALKAREGAEAQQVAEATMVFDYRQIAAQLRAILDDRGSGVKPRLNAVYALRIRPEKEAISELIKLLDDSDEAVAAASSEALQEWIPVGPDKQVWRGILEDLKKKSREDIVKERLKVLELQKRDLSAKLDTWQKLYTASLKRMYDGISEPAARQAFLVEQLQSEQSLVKLWGLERVREMGLSEPQLPADIAARAVALVGDPEPAVRLATAKLLALKTNVDSAAELLAQLKVESDENVKGEQLSALGAVCYYALLPGSQIKLPVDIRSDTLSIAGQYLQDKDVKKAARGADIVSKLVEQNGLKALVSAKYLEMLQQRYAAVTSESKDSPLRADIFKAMGRLCEAGGHKAEAAGLFGPLFSDAIKDNQAAVREAAFAGLVSIDKASALVVMRQHGLSDDGSLVVRGQAARLAGSVGDVEDLAWLAPKLGVADESDGAWQAMKLIFDRTDVKVALEWVQKFEDAALVEKIGPAEWPVFLAFVEQRAGNAEGGAIATAMRQKLAAFHKEKAGYDNAATYYRKLMDGASGQEKDGYAAACVEMYLKSGSADALKGINSILSKRIEGGEFASGDVVVAKVSEYLGGTDVDKAKAVLDSLAAVKGGPAWQEVYAKWRKDIAEAGRAAK